MTSAILVILAIAAVFAAIWLFIKIEHFVVRVVGFLVTLGACLFLVHLFIGGRI